MQNEENMISTQELLKQAISLPVEERVSLADSILKSINRTNNEIDRQWIELAKKRLADLRSGKVQAIPGKEVFEKIRERFEK